MPRGRANAGQPRLGRSDRHDQTNQDPVLFRGEAPLWKVVTQRVGWTRRSVDPWWLALLDRLGLAGRRGLRSFEIRRQDGMSARLLVRLGGADQRTINEVWLGRAYDQRLEGWASGHIDVIFDIGANAGYFSVLAARLAPGARIVTVEPEPENQRLLEANLLINGIAPTMVRAGVVESCAEERLVRLHRSSDPRLHTMKPEVGRRSRTLTGEILDVQVVTLPDLCRLHAPPPTRIGLKIDIEGDEWPVLQSLPDDVLERVVVAAVESDDPMPQPLKDRLERLGFGVTADVASLYSISRSLP